MVLFQLLFARASLVWADLRISLFAVAVIPPRSTGPCIWVIDMQAPTPLLETKRTKSPPPRSSSEASHLLLRAIRGDVAELLAIVALRLRR